jgi:hypothetical protein
VTAATLTAWLMTGASRGWTKTSVPVEKTDEVTGLSYRTYQKRFEPGMDFLAAGLSVAALCGLASWASGRRRKSTNANYHA